MIYNYFNAKSIDILVNIERPHQSKDELQLIEAWWRLCIYITVTS